MDSQSKGENAKAAEAGNESEANRIAKAADKPSARKPKKAGRPKKQKSKYPGLAAYESNELPPVTEFALLAAILGPRESYPGQHENAAFRNAVKFYQRAAEFHRAYGKATPEKRANLCGDFRLVTEAKLWPYARNIPQPTKFPASYDEFLRLVVKGIPADAEKRLRDFFRSECPKDKDADSYAAERLGNLKQEGFAPPCQPDIRIEQRGSKYCAVQRLVSKATAEQKVKETVLFEAATEQEVKETVKWQIENTNILAQTEGWINLAGRVLRWHEEQVANTNRLNRLGKTKQPPLAEA